MKKRRPNPPLDVSRPPAVSVIVPSFDSASFICRALESVLAQSRPDWEVIIVDDGSRDDTANVIGPYLDDLRISFVQSAINQGLGAALNIGIERSRADVICYLPADDVYFRGHLESLLAVLEADTEVVLAYAGVRHHYNRESLEAPAGEPLQLVQVAHRRVDERWMERRELTTDDLDSMFWHKLKGRGAFRPTGVVTCEWVDHPGQRHKTIREPVGGIQAYRQRYGVAHPMRFHSSVGNYIDEIALYARYRNRDAPPNSPDGLKILLVGELAYNADRIVALAERGHRLYGLWMKEPYWYNTIGPLPFGHVHDLPRVGWADAVRDIRPDVVYALLNWQAVPFAHEVMSCSLGSPFVWHFKEGPFICLEKGTWPMLIDLYTRADGRIYSSPEMRMWFEALVPNRLDPTTSLVLDGDLPKADWAEGAQTPKLSADGDEIHTVVPGRPIGLHPCDVEALAALGIHLHFYGDFTHGQWKAWIEACLRSAPRHLHLHSQVQPDRWVEEFSRYDAGWLHCFESTNAGDIHRANWDDLNYPARMATLALAGLPMLQRNNDVAIVATQSLARTMDIGVFFRTWDDLAHQLKNRKRLAHLSRNVLAHRKEFTFDHHVEAVERFFHKVIRSRAGKREPDCRRDSVIS